MLNNIPEYIVNCMVKSKREVLKDLEKFSLKTKELGASDVNL